MGSEPLEFKVPPLNLKTLDMTKTHQELIELEKEIKTGVDFTDMSLVNSAAEHDVSVQLKISPKWLQKSSADHASDQQSADDNGKVCSVSVGLKANVPLAQLQVQFYVEPPLKCSAEAQFFETIESDSVEQIDTEISFESNLLASSAKVSVVVSFINGKCVPRVIRKTELLPLDMFCVLDTPQKEATHKVTITVENADAPTIEGLFPEFIAEISSSGAIGVKMLHSDALVTVISAKNSNRFRCGISSI